MTDRSTLLAHVALKLGVHPENIAVEALGYILSSSAPAVRALEDVLRTGGADVGRLSKVRTQASDEEGTRPDLAGYDDDRAERVLIEAKFWAGLTDHQPVAYLKRLPADRPSALLFVAPAARSETLWTELRKRVVESGELQLGADVEFNENLQSGSVAGGGRRLILTSWEALLNSMASHASVAGDSSTETDIRQLLGLTERMDDDAFLPIRAEELGPEFPRRVLGLPSIIEAAIKRGSAAGWIDTTGLSTGATARSWGRYVRLGRVDRADALFGFSFEFWANRRDTPLRVRFYESDNTMRLQEVRSRLEQLQHEDPPRVILLDDYVIVPISLPLGVEQTAVVDSVVAQLKRVARMIDPQV